MWNDTMKAQNLRRKETKKPKNEMDSLIVNRECDNSTFVDVLLHVFLVVFLHDMLCITMCIYTTFEKAIHKF